jgi:hypothetical protein
MNTPETQTDSQARVCVEFMRDGGDLSMVLIQPAPWPWMEETLGPELEAAGLGQFDSADMSVLPMKFFFSVQAENSQAAIRAIIAQLDAAGILKYARVYQA